MRTHQQIEARSLAMHRAIAERVRADPALLERVRATLARWLAGTSPRTRGYLEEWQRIVEAGPDAVVAALTAEAEHAATLRQCSPFTGILSNRERFALLRAWRETHAA
jgi:hypothetical protein